MNYELSIVNFQLHCRCVATILGRIEAADGGETRGVAAGAVDIGSFFKDIGALWQRVEEVVGVGVAHGTIVAEATLPAIA